MNREEDTPMKKNVSWLLVVLVVLGLGVGLVLSHDNAYAYEPVDDLIMVVNQLHQTGEIAEVTVMSNLVVNLETIGALVDEGNPTTAKVLLDAFAQEVQSLRATLMTSLAADQLVSQANVIATAL